MAIPSAFILRRTGYKKGISLGLLVMAAGTILFLPAAYSRVYIIFLAGLFITGTGMVLLQTAVNPYVVIIGPQESAARRISFMGLSNKIAGIAGQRILGSVFLVDATLIVNKIGSADPAEKESILDKYVLKVIDPYLVITGVLIILAVIVFLSSLPEVEEEGPEDYPLSKDTGRVYAGGILKYPYLILGIIALFVEGACEVIPIDGVIVYSRSLGISLNEARHFAEYTLYCMLLGYTASILLVHKYISQQKALFLCSLSGIMLSLAAFSTTGMTSVTFIISMGFVSAWFWGTIWGLAIRKLGNYTKIGSALMLMSVIGGGIFPLIFGSLIDISPAYPQFAVLMLIPCYMYLFFYAVKGHKIKRWTRSPDGNSKSASLH